MDEEEKKEKKPGRHAASRTAAEEEPQKAPIYLDQDSPYPLPRSFSPYSSSAPSRSRARRTVSGSSAVVPNRPQPVRTFKKERKKTRKKVLAVAVASSFATLIVVCAVILFVTDGKGTDIFWREAVSKSQSIKSDTEKLAGQLEDKKNSASQKEAPAEGGASTSSPSAQGQPAGESPSSPSTSSPEQKADSAPSSPSPDSSHSPSAPAPGEQASPSQQAPSASSSQSGSEAQKKEEKDKKAESSTAQNAPDPTLGQKSSANSAPLGSKN